MPDAGPNGLRKISRFTAVAIGVAAVVTGGLSAVAAWAHPAAPSSSTGTSRGTTTSSDSGSGQAGSGYQGLDTGDQGGGFSGPPGGPPSDGGGRQGHGRSGGS